MRKLFRKGDAFRLVGERSRRTEAERETLDKAGADAAFRKGVEMTLTQLLEVMAALGVTPIEAVGKYDIRNVSALVQNGQRVDAVALQHLPRLAALGHGQTQRVVVGSLVHGLVGRAAAQEKLADISIRHHGLQFAVGRNKQDALAGLVQFAQRVQHGGGGFNKQFFDFQQGFVPLKIIFGSGQYRIILSADTASEVRQLLSQKRRQYWMSYRAFWQRRCCAAAAGAVLEPSGGNCAVLS